jgi:hypothetical protein
MARLLTLLLLAALATTTAHAQSPKNNGARVGKAGYLLNVIAFDKCPRGDFAGSNRRSIAVQADFAGVATDTASTVNKVFLQSGTNFQVQDGNACDADGARLQLPVDAANCRNCASTAPIAPTFRQFEVRARVLGKPHGNATITDCVSLLEIDPVTQAEVATSLCSVGQDDIWVGAGNEWLNASRQLLTVCVDKSGDGVCDDRIGLFDSSGRDYWWSFDNSGRPHVQLVFFAVPAGSTGGGGGS